MSSHFLEGSELNAHNAEARRIEKQRNSDETRLYIKFFRNQKYMEQLITGQFYCNTPAYYRENYEPGVGDNQEGLMYAVSREDGGIDPLTRIAGLTLGEILEKAGMPPASELAKLEFIPTRPTHEAGWLHCWFVFALPNDPKGLGSLATDLHRVLQEFGTNYVTMTNEGLHAIMERAENAGIKPMRMAKVGYSDHHLHNNISCKRTIYAYQREFRLIFSECDDAELAPRVFDFGDISDLLHVNPELKIPDKNGTVHLKLSEDGLWLNPETFSAKIS